MDARRNGTFPKSRRLEASGAAWNCGPSDFPATPRRRRENSVDLAHLRYVHGYDDVKAVGSATVDGAVLVSRFDFRSRRRIAGFAHSIYEFSVTAYVHGLGYSFVHIHEHTIGINSRLWILATPVDGTFIDLVLAGQVQEIRKPKRLIAGLAFLPEPLANSDRFGAAQEHPSWQRRPRTAIGAILMATMVGSALAQPPIRYFRRTSGAFGRTVFREVRPP